MRQLLITASAMALMAACANGVGGINDDGRDETNDGGAGPSAGVGSNGAGNSGSTATGPSGAGGATPSGSSGSSGSGGDPATTSSASTTSSTTSGMMNTCLHDTCTEGAALTVGCGDPCVDVVCAADSYCCTSGWDSICVDEAVQLCGAMCAGGGAVSPGDLVITEIMNNPAVVSDASGEWFEIYNDAPYAIDLQGLTLQHQASPPQTETIGSSVVIAPGGYAVLGINANSSTNGNVTVNHQYSSAVNLSNTSDYIAILDGATLIDEVSYSSMSGLNPNGKSRNLDPLYQNAFDNDTDAHFCQATSTMASGVDLGTPGASNDTCP